MEELFCHQIFLYLHWKTLLYLQHSNWIFVIYLSFVYERELSHHLMFIIPADMDWTVPLRMTLSSSICFGMVFAARCLSLSPTTLQQWLGMLYMRPPALLGSQCSWQLESGGREKEKDKEEKIISRGWLNNIVVIRDPSYPHKAPAGQKCVCLCVCSHLCRKVNEEQGRLPRWLGLKGG